MYKHLFPAALQMTYLDTAAEGLLLAGSEEALSGYLRAKERGTPGREELYAVEAETIELAPFFAGGTWLNLPL